MKTMWEVVELDFDDKLVVLTDGETEIKMERVMIASERRSKPARCYR